jgi:DNA-binding CsgD family transcriptional regulator
VLLVDSCRVDGFSIDDQSAVEALVAVAALAVSNHHQSVSHRRFEEWMSVIEDTATVLLSGVAPRAVLDGVLDRIAREALHSTGAEMAGVATPDPSGTSMLFRIAVGAESEFLSSQPFPEDQSLSGHVRRTGEVLLVADAMLDRRSYGPVSERIGLGPTAIGPLWLNRRAIGVVFVGNHRHGRELDPTLAIRAVTSADLAQHLQVAGTRRPNGVASSALTEASIDRLTEFADELDGWSQLMSLDEREINLLLMVAEGLTNREIADHLDLAEKTIRNTMTVLWARLGVRNRVQAAVLVARHVERLGRLGALRSDC